MIQNRKRQLILDNPLKVDFNLFLFIRRARFEPVLSTEVWFWFRTTFSGNISVISNLMLPRTDSKGRVVKNNNLLLVSYFSVMFLMFVY